MTKPTSRSLLREPFLHFVILGAAIFGTWALVGEPAPEPSSSSPPIVIGQERLLELESGFAASQGRRPDEVERAELLRQAVADEVLYREGIAAGLSRGDPIVRRRVIQKMRFVLERTNPAAEPTEAELDAWIASQATTRPGVPAVALRQLFFDGQERADARRDAARALAAALAGDELPDGDAFLFGHELGLRSLDRYRADLGPAFAQVVSGLPEGGWGLAESPWGWHLVQVQERRSPGDQSRAFAREQARAELARDRRREATSQAVRDLVAGYEVTVEADAP